MSHDLQRTRERVARTVLAAHDFEDFTVTETGSQWQQDGPDRLFSIVSADDADGTTHRAQLNVWFHPGTANVSDVYEGDWVVVD